MARSITSSVIANRDLFSSSEMTMNFFIKFLATITITYLSVRYNDWTIALAVAYMKSFLSSSNLPSSAISRKVFLMTRILCLYCH